MTQLQFYQSNWSTHPLAVAHALFQTSELNPGLEFFPLRFSLLNFQLNEMNEFNSIAYAWTKTHT